MKQGKANFVNRTLFQGDNLNYLRLLESESVDLIATDPPFNKGRDFHADPKSLKKEKSGGSFVDRWSWKKDVQEVWLEELNEAGKDTDLVTAIEGIRNTHSDAMGAYLCYMSVRLLSMRRVLKSTGTIYLHCDRTASHYLKMIMDVIFGKENFRNEIVWCYRGGGVPSNDFANKHDIIFRYSKSDEYKFNLDDVRIPYSEDSAARLRYTARAFRGENVYDNYEQNPKGKHPEDWWVIQAIAPSSKERRDAKNYPTQKPLTLYKRIIEASSNPGDVVLDPFCGCATTLIAAELLGRHWIGIDLWKEVYDTVEHRLVNMKGTDLEGSEGLTKDELPMFDLGRITKITDPSQIENPYKGEPAAPYQRQIKRYDFKKEPWEKLSYREMVDELASVEQKGDTDNEAVCVGCGRSVEIAFMELDHVKPKADGGENNISNRVLLCPKCNRRKKHTSTISGLWKDNEKDDWMFNAERAKVVLKEATDCWKRIKAKKAAT